MLGLWAPWAWADKDTDLSREALARAEEMLSIELEKGGLVLKDVTPLMLVSVAPAYETSSKWYPTEALKTVVSVFGKDSVRVCEACMAPRVYSQEGRIDANSTPLDVAEIKELDARYRGESTPAKTAIWLDETPTGVSIRWVDLSNSRILFAQNVDPTLKEYSTTLRSVRLTSEVTRRIRGDSLTHTFVDLRLVGSFDLSLEWLEQWGDTNQNMSGLSVSVGDPVAGIGAAYYRVIPQALNLMLGGRVMLSVPTAIVQGISGQNDVNVISPLLTASLIARMPIPNTNMAAHLYASTNGVFGVGLTLLNLTLLPFLP